MAIGMIAKLKIQDGKNEEFEAAFREIQAAVTAEEPGCNFYSCHRTDEPTEYIVLEQYADEAAVAAHGEHLKELGGKLAGIMGGRPEIQRLESI